MADKPFIAARIPESLSLKLEEHSKNTGESKTQALINALCAYLGYSPEGEEKESASDRLSLLEKKVEELEKLLREPQQISLLDLPEVLPKQAKPKTKADKITDNKSDNKIAPDSKPLEEAKNGLNNREMSDVTGLKYEAVRSKHKNNRPITFNGKEYLPVKEGNFCKWRFS